MSDLSAARPWLRTCTPLPIFGVVQLETAGVTAAWEDSDRTDFQKTGMDGYFPHRAAAAFLAIIFRLLADKLSARALPPLDAPSFDSATAAGFFSRSGLCSGSGLPSHFAPMIPSTAERAGRFGSRGRFGLLAREGMVRLWHGQSSNGSLAAQTINSIHFQCRHQPQGMNTGRILRRVGQSCRYGLLAGDQYAKIRAVERKGRTSRDAL